MFKFYLYLWFFWVLRMFLVSITLSAFLSFFITSYFYLTEGLPALESEILTALFKIFTFWFLLLLNLTILIALFINTKYLFNNCINRLCLRLQGCKKEDEGVFLQSMSAWDLVKVWRKLLLLIVWISAIFVLLSFFIFYFLSSEGSFFEWLSVYHLYGYILISGFFAFTLLGSRCKDVSLRLC